MRAAAPKKLLSLDVNLGTLIAALGPAGLILWQGMSWASDIEAKVNTNTDQIHTMILRAENREIRQENRDRERSAAQMQLLNQLARLIEKLEQNAAPTPQ